MSARSPRPADDRLVAMARWLVSLDDENMAAARRTLTLDDVIGEARAALTARTPQLAEPCCDCMCGHNHTPDPTLAHIGGARCVACKWCSCPHPYPQNEDGVNAK